MEHIHRNMDLESITRQNSEMLGSYEAMKCHIQSGRQVFKSYFNVLCDCCRLCVPMLQ